MSWFAALEGQQSLGQTVARPGSLAGLAAAREAHLGQFYTPRAVVDLMWRIAQPAIDASLQRNPHARVSVLDIGCGVGRMFWPADPDKHLLLGCDVEHTAIAALKTALDATAFVYDVRQCAMEHIAFSHVGVALLNPPFSLALQSPHLIALPGITTWGRYGADSAATSTAYTIGAALAGSDSVIAVVPAGFVDAALQLCAWRPRLRAVIDLPKDSFADEGTHVATALLVFGPTAPKLSTVRLSSVDLTADQIAAFKLRIGSTADLGQPLIRQRDLDDANPVITKAVTGNTRVTVARDGRKLLLGFACGFTQARVQNAVLRARIVREDKQGRLPAGVEFTGQGILDIENILATRDPMSTFQRLLRIIADNGGSPVVANGMHEYLQGRIALKALRATPFARTAYVPVAVILDRLAPGASMAMTAIATHVVDPTSWTGAVVKKGEAVQIQRDGDGTLTLIAAGQSLGPIDLVDAQRLYAPAQAATTDQREWQQIHAGRAHAFPLRAKARRAQIAKLGLDRILDRDYQIEDLIELSLDTRGVCGWCPAAGKTRLAYALSRIRGGKHNLVVVESRLIPDMTEQWRALDAIPAESWQVIRSPDQLSNLRQVNIISYERLRMAIAAGRGAERRTYARALRRRIHTLICDEGGILANRESAQSRAIAMVSPKCRFAFDGTPIGNHSRDVLPLFAWSAGDGVAPMPYGIRQPYIEVTNATSMARARRGIDVFSDTFCSYEWVTAEFQDGLVKGAKREVPYLRNVEAFRALVAPQILRRHPAEPALRKYMQIPTPTTEVVTVPWAPDHLALYLRVADEFADYYRQANQDKGKAVNFVTLLARINAVVQACNSPGKRIGREAAYSKLTSKQLKALDILREDHAGGHKTLFIAHSPHVCLRLATELEASGIETVVFTGLESIAKRTKKLQDEFKRGEASVLLATTQVIMRGHNLPMANRALFYDRDWSPDTEEQCGRRLLRGEQTRPVHFRYLHLAGSIDTYQARMTQLKGGAIDAGLDLAEQLGSPEDFEHMDKLLNDFVADLASRKGLEAYQLRNALKAGASA